MKNRILFILKRRDDYHHTKHSSHIGLSTGLYNSASFVVDMLNANGISAKMVVVIDNNDIDREVIKYNPTHVIIESLWVVPTKFSILTRLHPRVKWIIRLHSEIPFLANESVAMDWIPDYYTYRNVSVACNSPRIKEELDYYLDSIYENVKYNIVLFRDLLKPFRKEVIYLPNIYPTNFVPKIEKRKNNFLDIGCFGAIRPLKNHLNQALAAIRYADSLKKKLNFHVNSGRVEMRGEPVTRNLASLFSHVSKKGHKLVNHEWTHREDFLKLCGTMDLGMQVSFSETFNIVAADFISQSVPIVVSDEIPWSSNFFTADPQDTGSIYRALYRTGILKKANVFFNQQNLISYTNESARKWLKEFDK